MQALNSSHSFTGIRRNVRINKSSGPYGRSHCATPVKHGKRTATQQNKPWLTVPKQAGTSSNTT